MIKLRYKTINFNGLAIHYAKYRKNRNIRLTVDGNGMIRLTCPYYASEEEIIAFIESKEAWIRKWLVKKNDTINLSTYPKLSNAQKKELLLKISTFIEKYEVLMNTKVNNISLRKMKSLWGSCSYKERNIRFNTYLYYMSDSFIEYIVVHEMAHLFVPNHSKNFYNIVKKFMPDYKNRLCEQKKVSLR